MGVALHKLTALASRALPNLAFSIDLHHIKSQMKRKPEVMKSCKVVRGGEGFLGKQGLNYFSGISAESANAEAICMHMLVMPPGASAKPHYHEAHETAIYMLEGVPSRSDIFLVDETESWQQQIKSRWANPINHFYAWG